MTGHVHVSKTRKVMCLWRSLTVWKLVRGPPGLVSITWCITSVKHIWGAVQCFYQHFKLKNIIQQDSWGRNVLKDQEEEEEELLPVWMIYCLFTELMGAGAAAEECGRVEIRTIPSQEEEWWRLGSGRKPVDPWVCLFFIWDWNQSFCVHQKTSDMKSSALKKSPDLIFQTAGTFSRWLAWLFLRVFFWVLN